MDKSVPQPQYGLQCFDKVISSERITTHISLSSYRNILNGWDQVTICWDDLHQNWEEVRKVQREAGSFFVLPLPFDYNLCGSFFFAQFCKRLGYISHFIFPSVIIYHDIQPWKRSIVNDNGCSVIKIALAYVVVIWLKGKLWWWWWKKPPTSLASSSSFL